MITMTIVIMIMASAFCALRFEDFAGLGGNRIAPRLVLKRRQ